MDGRTLLTSLRTVRRYRPDPLDPATRTRILDAGRLTGSATNRQPWTFIVVGPGAREAVAAALYSPAHVLSAPFVVAVAVSPAGRLYDVDAGRAAQSMMLAAWHEGVGSCPNGVADPPALDAALGLEAGRGIPVVISFGVPDPPRDPTRRTPDAWSAGARRRPLGEVVRVVGGDA